MRIQDIFQTVDLTEAKQTWQKHKNPRAGGMSKKAVRSYRRSNPGSKIQTAVTTKPSKLKKGSKASKRRLSFCRRMRGMKKKRTSAKTARDPNSAINKSLRRWNCESVQEMQELIMIAGQRIQTLRESNDALEYERRQQRAMDREREQFKRDELEFELGGEEERMRAYNEGTFYLRINGRIWQRDNRPVMFQGRERAVRAGQTIKNRSPEKSVVVTRRAEDDVVTEKKDACYNKVRSRYKVWPSAYASGALVQCRKKGAANWGTGGKK
jgi:hypothetical protein